MAELEHQLESARHESQVRTAEETVAWVEGQHAAERVTTTERGLEAAKAHQAETEAELWTSLAETEVALQKSLETHELERSVLASEWTALEAERKARSEVDWEVLVLRG